MEILQQFLNIWYWHFNSYAVICYTSKNKLQHFIAKNRKGKHAEDNAITQLKSLVDGKKLGSPSIKMYVNNSPCQKCSEKISEFLGTIKSEHSIDLKIELVFSRFYQVRRPSNEENPHYAGRLPSPKQHEAQVQGLKKLCRHGVDLRTFNTEDWLDLAKTLGVDPVKVNCRAKRCDLLRKDFEKVVGLTSIQIPQPPLKSKTGPEEDINKRMCKEDTAGTASCPAPPKLGSLHLARKDEFSTSEEKVTDKCVDVMVTKHKCDEMEISQNKCNNVVTAEDTHDDKAKTKDKGDDCDRNDSMGIVKGKCEDAATAKDKCNKLMMIVENKYHPVITVVGNEGNEVLSAQEKLDDVMIAKDKSESMWTTKDRSNDEMTAKYKCGIMGTAKDTCQNFKNFKTKEETCNNVLAAKDKCDEVMTVKGQCDEVMAVKDKCDEVMTVKGQCDEVMTVKDKCDEVMTVKDKCDEVMTAKDKCDEVMTTKDKCNEVIATKGKCDIMGHLDKNNDSVMTAKDNYEKWDDAMIAKDKYDQTKTAQDKRDNLNTGEDQWNQMESPKGTDIRKKQEGENTNIDSTEANILGKADELKESKLRAAWTHQEKEMRVSEAEYSFLKYLKLYYKVRKMERYLGIPEELGVNSVITTKVPFKVKD